MDNVNVLGAFLSAGCFLAFDDDDDDDDPGCSFLATGFLLASVGLLLLSEAGFSALAGAAAAVCFGTAGLVVCLGTGGFGSALVSALDDADLFTA